MDDRKLSRLISRLLIAFGVMLINIFLFSALSEYICKLIYHLSVMNLLGSGNFEKVSANQISAVRLFQGIVSFGTFAFSAWVLAYIFRQRPVEYLGLETFPRPLFYLLIPVLLLVSMPLLTWLLEWNAKWSFPSFLSGLESKLRSMEDKNEKLYGLLLRMDGYPSLIYNLVVMALIPALGEELFCRGVLLNIVYDYTGRFFRSIMIVAMIFTLFHVQFFKFVPMVLLAIILGMFINWTKGIWASVLFHFLNNSMAVMGSFYYARGYKNLFTDEHAQVSGWLCILSLFLTLGVFMFIHSYSNRQQIIRDE